MEPMWKLVYLAEPSYLALIITAVSVVLASAYRALSHERESDKYRDQSENSIIIDGSQAIMIPIASSFSLIIMFYLFSSVSQLVMAFTAVASASSLTFCLSPFVSQICSFLGLPDLVFIRRCFGGLTRVQFFLAALSCFTVFAWLVSGHWLLNNLLGISICIAFVSHVRLPNIKVCALLLSCLFVYDIFWVFFSEHFFGANVMVTVATQQAHNPVHTVAQNLNLPVAKSVSRKLDLPVKLLFPRDLLQSSSNATSNDFMMLGLGDMAIPGMLLALVLCYDNRKIRSIDQNLSQQRNKGSKYIVFAAVGYTVGLIFALSAGFLSHSPQPALLYLVPSTLGPVAVNAWQRNELNELWNGPFPRPTPFEKDRLIIV